MIKSFIADNDTERLDKLLARLSGSTRTLISGHIESGFVQINGVSIKKSSKIKLGEIITVDFQPEPMPNLTAKDIHFDILVDNENYAIIDKPPYLTVHPAPGNYDNTLVNALLYKFNIEYKDDDFRPGIVHRLDKDTSGILIIAKNYDAKLKLSGLFANRNIRKKYIAILHGRAKFDEQTVDKAILRDKKNRKRMTVGDSGKSAVSIFNIKELYKDVSLAEVEILTGRTHQIRVHAKHILHPLVGDILYGGRGMHGLNRQALHSYSLEFIDPYTKQDVFVTSQLPEDMVSFLDKIKLEKQIIK